MKITCLISRIPALLLLGAAPAALAQTVIPLYAADTTEHSRALARPDPAGNASAALSNGGNPAAAIGAAQGARRATINRAPSIMGRAGTIGVNGEIGDAAAASSANGVDTVGTPDVESIGMRRARHQAGLGSGTDEVPAAPVTAAPPPQPPSRVQTAPQPLGAALRSSTLAGREALLAQLEEQLQANAATITPLERPEPASPALRRARNAAAAAEARLQERLLSARRATAAEWPDVRTVLAADYEAYLRAVADVHQLTATGR